MHNSFVYNVRLLFSKDTIGPIPPAVLLLSDGGHYQNLAILPLLQRKVKRIVVVDGGYKDEEDKYGDSILDALKIARTQLNCSFYNEDGKDVITDLMRSFVNPQKRNKPHCYKYVLSALSRGGSRIIFRRGCTRLLLYFNTNKPHSFFFSEYQLY